VPPHCDVCELSDPDACRSRCEIGTDQDRIRNVAHPVRSEVMLPEPDGLKAHLVGKDRLFTERIEERVVREPMLRVAQRTHQGKSHLSLLSCRNSMPAYEHDAHRATISSAAHPITMRSFSVAFGMPVRFWDSATTRTPTPSLT